MITQRCTFPFTESYPLRRLGDQENMIFFDIETTGFSGSCHQVYLIGCAFLRQGAWQLIQWFADDMQSEKELLTAFFTLLEDFQVLVHFNGDGFDIPFLLKRCQVYGLAYGFSALKSIDLYKRIKPYRKLLALDHLKQKSLEHFLGIFRQDPYSGGQLTQVYQDYLMTREETLYSMLMLHNREDLEGMPRILPMLFYPDFFQQEFLLREERLQEPHTPEESGPLLTLILEGRDFLPVPISWETPLALCKAGDNLLYLTIKLFCGTLKHFYSNYKDYYYLIYEDTAIHKSVGEYVEKAARKRAAPHTCYTKKEGLFLPQPKGLWSPSFQEAYKSQHHYTPYIPGLFSSPSSLSAYIRYILGL